MASLILVDQGSPCQETNAEAIGLTVRLGTLGLADVVACAFLEHAAPLLDNAIDVHVAHGAQEIVLLPLFLHAGAHVARDIPAIVAAARARHPHVCFRLLEHIGASSFFVASIERLVHARSDTAGDIDTVP